MTDDLGFAVPYDTKVRIFFHVSGRDDLELNDGSMLRPETLHLTISFTPEYAVQRRIEAVVGGKYIEDGQPTKLGHQVEVWDNWPSDQRPDWVVALVQAHLPESLHG